MKNSIEEDIILLNDFIESNLQRDKLENYKGSYKMGYFYYKDIQQAIEHILSDYKRVLKENEDFKDAECLVKRYFKLKDINTYLQKENEQLRAEVNSLKKENEELKAKENKIYKEVQENLSFEKFLIAKDREPDLFNQGRFYISQIVYDILNDVQNPEGIHKENKYIKYVNFIPVQKVKEKIEELKEDKDSKYYYIFLEERDIENTIKILQELLDNSK